MDAVTCALALQDDLGDSQRVGEPLRVRIGVHIGSAVTTDHDVFGAAVAFTARVASEASGVPGWHRLHEVVRQ